MRNGQLMKIYKYIYINITPVLGEEIFSLKIQYGIRRYLYQTIHACFKSKYVPNN
jgi:hypothetical protein